MKQPIGGKQGFSCFSQVNFLKVYFCCSTHSKVIDYTAVKKRRKNTLSPLMITLQVSILQGLLLRLYLLYAVLLNRWKSSQRKINVYVQILQINYTCILFTKCLLTQVWFQAWGFWMFFSLSCFPCRLSEVLHSKLLISANTLCLLLTLCPTCFFYRRLFCFVYLYYMLAIIISYSSS